MFFTRWTDSLRRTTGATARSGVTATPRRFRPTLESMEDRAVPASLLDISDVNLGGLAIVDGVLTVAEGTVEGTLAGLPFTTDISNFALELIPDDPATPAVEPEATVLHLELAPIDIDLLGLHVDTSAICLDVTATQGDGLLGDLLFNLAGGLPLGDLPILGGATGLNNVVEGILDGVLGRAMKTAGDPPEGAEDICDGECEILDLAIGPVDLSLLGLNVSLDNCEDGPIQVCLSASAGEGILGDLFCGLTGGPDLPAVPDLPDGLSLKEYNKLVKTATRLSADGDFSLKDVNKLVKQFNRMT